MNINWQQIITALIATIGGGGVLLGAVAWLIRTLVSDRLARDAERFSIEMKARADTEMERVRAHLSQTARIHERQVDTLAKLYRFLFEAQAYLQSMASSVRFEGEISGDDYRKLCAEAIASARSTFLDGRLLIPPDLSRNCDQFFRALFQGQNHLAFAEHPAIVDGLQRAGFWNKAQKTAYEEIPSILQNIETAARDLIHGQPRLSSAAI